MKAFFLGKEKVDSVELKCLLVSKGIRVDNAVYKQFGKDFRLDPNPLTCNSLMLSDGTNVQLTDVNFHLKHLAKTLSWNNLKLMKYASQLATPFRLNVLDDKPALFYGKDFVDFVSFHKKSDFYRQTTSSGLPFAGNAVLQGRDFVSFQCLWYCEYAATGKPCQYCFSGAYFEALSRKNRPQPQAVPASDVAEIVRYAVVNDRVNSLQLTGGSTFSGRTEHTYITAYLNAIADCGTDLSGEILLYITPPDDHAFIDEYFALGASRIACSLEVWDEERAKIITPGKMHFTTRERHLKALTCIAEKYGKNKAFSNFIIGLESVETLTEGARWLAERGIIPSASVWMPMGRPVMDSMATPDLDYFRRVKDMLADLYSRYALSPAGGSGLNVCIEKDIYLYMQVR
jgi:biotin synthase-related radical SAM superfamily protein